MFIRLLRFSADVGNKIVDFCVDTSFFDISLASLETYSYTSSQNVSRSGVRRARFLTFGYFSHDHAQNRLCKHSLAQALLVEFKLSLLKSNVSRPGLVSCTRTITVTVSADT
jgi:hypothetical protein